MCARTLPALQKGRHGERPGLTEGRRETQAKRRGSNSKRASLFPLPPPPPKPASYPLHHSTFWLVSVLKLPRCLLGARRHLCADCPDCPVSIFNCGYGFKHSFKSFLLVLSFMIPLIDTSSLITHRSPFIIRHWGRAVFLPNKTLCHFCLLLLLATVCCCDLYQATLN